MSKKTVRYKNPTGDTIRADGIIDGSVGPGEEVDVPEEYCRKRHAATEGKFRPSVISELAPQLVPVEDVTKLAPLPVVPPKIAPSQADFEAQGLAPGIAEIAAKQAAAAAAAKAPPIKPGAKAPPIKPGAKLPSAKAAE
jgi:hypothetical protein